MKSTHAMLKNCDSENRPYIIIFLFVGIDATNIISINTPGNAYRSCIFGASIYIPNTRINDDR